MDPNDKTKTGAEGGATDDISAIDAALDAGAGAGGDTDDSLAAIDAALAEDDGAGADAAANTASAGSDTAAGQDGAAGDDQDPAAAAAAGKADGEGAPDPAAGQDAKPEPNAEDLAEAKSLGLKDKANERFVAMAGEIRSLAPLKAALDQAGITDAADLPKMVERAKAADDMIAMVMETGATSEQYGMSLDYLALVNKGLAGDRAAAEKAFDLISDEYLSLAKALGREVPGLHDPVAEFPDLASEIESGDLTRARALEIARQRQNDRALQQRAEQQRQQQQGAQQQGQRVEAGRIALGTWDRQMQTADPHYLAKRGALHEAVYEIRTKLPPEQWIEATKQAYAAIPDPKPAPDPKPRPSAMRPTGASRTLTPQSFDDPMEAMEAAILAGP